MVSKLAVAVQENYLRAVDEQDQSTATSLLQAYREIQAGLGMDKTPEEYGAFPNDPYSHTPQERGAQQPGMTGQVKEDILTRFTELGIRVADGQLSFDDRCFRQEERRCESGILPWFDFNGKPQSIAVEAGEFAFTFCQTPIVYSPGVVAEIRVIRPGQRPETMAGLQLPKSISQAIFERTGEINQLRVSFPGWLNHRPDLPHPEPPSATTPPLSLN